MKPKFRFWDTVEKRMLDWHLVCQSAANHNGIHLLYEVMINPRYEKLQWTGLKDARGIDIYEGDILRGKTRNQSVVWSDSTGWVTNEGLPVWAFHKPELIGNVFEDAELLEAKV